MCYISICTKNRTYGVNVMMLTLKLYFKEKEVRIWDTI